MQRVLALLIVVILILGGAFLLFWDSPGATPKNGAVNEESGTENRAPEAGRLDPIPAAPPTPTAEIGRVEATAPEAPPDPLVGTPLPEGEGMLVRVLITATREPLAYAEVLVADIGEEDMPRVQQLLLETRDIEAVLEALSVVYRTGAEGTVRVPMVRGDGALAARKGSLFGVARDRGRDSQEVEILCSPSVSISAMVVDGDGKPVEGIPVALRIHRSGSSHSPLSLRTDVQGVARFRRLELFLEDEQVVSAALAVDGPIGINLEQGFDLEALPEEPLRFVLPEYGGVEIELQTADGEAWTEPAQVFVTEFVEGTETERFEFTRGGAVPLKEGKASFAPVGLGLALEISAARFDGTRIGRIVAPGPRRAGEAAYVLLHESLEYSQIEGILVDAEGAATAGIRIFAELVVEQEGSRSSDGFGFSTDANGHFRIEVREAALAAGASRKLVLREQPTTGAAARSVEVALDYSLPPGVTDLGAIAMVLPPYLVSGVVVDEAGEPVGHANVQVQRMERYGEGPDAWYWDYLQNGHVEADADGIFAVHASSDTNEIRVEAYAQSKWCEGTVTTVGASGVRVILREAAQLSGRVLLDAGSDPGRFRVRLRPLAPNANWGWRALDLSADGSFAQDELRPGRYAVELTLGNANEALIGVEEVLLVGGENHDPRLEPLDARGRTSAFEVRALGPDGQALMAFQVFRLRAGDRPHAHHTTTGVVFIPSGDGPADLIIQADAYLRETRLGVTDDCTVSLRAGVPLRITVSNASSIPAGYVLMIDVRAAQDSERGLWTRPRQFADATGSLQLLATELGAHEVVVHLMRTQDGNRAATLKHDLPQIEVGKVGGSWSLRLDEDDVQRGMSWLQE